MNLMFRKNFSGEKTISGGGGGGGKAKGALGAGRNAKRRDRGYSCMEEHHYRTHLFFSAPRSSAQYNDVSGTGNENSASDITRVTGAITASCTNNNSVQKLLQFCLRPHLKSFEVLI